MKPINSDRTMILESIIQTVKTRHNASWGDFLKQRFTLIFLATLATLADMFSTCYFMSMIGTQAEVHPFIRITSEVLGPVFGPIVGKTCQFTCVLLFSFYFTRYAFALLVSVTLLYSFAAWFNIWGSMFVI